MGRSRIRDEIVGLLQDFNRDSKTALISAKFAFPAKFTGFSGHFPDNPILPGVCQIQCVLVVLSQAFNAEIGLSEIHRAKFLNTVVPDEELLVKGTAECTENSVVGKFVITKQNGEEEVTVSRLKITGEKCL